MVGSKEMAGGVCWLVVFALQMTQSLTNGGEVATIRWTGFMASTLSRESVANVSLEGTGGDFQKVSRFSQPGHFFFERSISLAEPILSPVLTPKYATNIRFLSLFRVVMACIDNSWTVGGSGPLLEDRFAKTRLDRTIRLWLW